MTVGRIQHGTKLF